jgi:hypothetical protein
MINGGHIGRVSMTRALLVLGALVGPALSQGAFGHHEGSALALADAAKERAACSTGDFDDKRAAACCALYVTVQSVDVVAASMLRKSGRQWLKLKAQREQWEKLNCKQYAALLEARTRSRKHTPPLAPADGAKKKRCVFNCRPQCQGNYTTAGWEPTAKPIVPFVPFGWAEYHSTAGALHFNAKEYRYCSNGQGGAWHAVVKPVSSLKFKYVSGDAACPYRTFDKASARACLAGKWIHMDGDSLVRDQYYDILELVGAMESCVRTKTHESVEFLYKDIGLRISIGSMMSKDTGTFSTGAACPKPSWTHLANARFKKPDVHVYETGLWFFNKGGTSTEGLESDATYTRRMRCVGQTNPKGTLGIYRTTSPYFTAPPSFAQFGATNHARNILHNHTNHLAENILGGSYGFRELDVWQVVLKHGVYDRRQELTLDGVHYSGPASKWMTNVLLNMIC